MGKRETKKPGEYYYHYNKEEREKNLSHEIKNRQKRRFLQFNRSLFIIMMDIVIIVIVFIILRPFLQKEHEADVLSGYSLELKGFIFEEKAYISLKIRLVEDTDSNINIVKVIFEIEDSEEKLEIIDILPQGTNAVRMIRGELPLSVKEDQTVLAVVNIGKDKTVLGVKLEKE